MARFFKNVVQEICLDLLQKGYATAYVDFFNITHEILKNNGNFAPRQGMINEVFYWKLVLPSNLEEQIAILKSVEDEERKKHLYTEETLYEFKKLLILIDEAKEQGK